MDCRRSVTACVRACSHSRPLDSRWRGASWCVVSRCWPPRRGNGCGTREEHGNSGAGAASTALPPSMIRRHRRVSTDPAASAVIRHDLQPTPPATSSEDATQHPENAGRMPAYSRPWRSPASGFKKRERGEEGHRTPKKGQRVDSLERPFRFLASEGTLLARSFRKSEPQRNPGAPTGRGECLGSAALNGSCRDRRSVGGRARAPATVRAGSGLPSRRTSAVGIFADKPPGASE